MMKFKIIASKAFVTQTRIAKLKTCKFQPKLKAGMSVSEANGAIDAAMEKFINCLKKKGK